MRCKMADLRCKEVIDIRNGFRLGFVYDVIVNVVTGHLEAILVPGPCRYLGIFGREEDYLISWEQIKRIGEDIILVDCDGPYKREKCRRFIWG